MKKFLIVKPKSKKLYFKDLDLGRCYNHRYTHPPTHHPKLFIANILKNSTLFQLVLLFLKIKNKFRFPIFKIKIIFSRNSDLTSSNVCPLVSHQYL